MDYKIGYFAGGCFWGVEHLFSNLEGVIDAVSGYMGGESENPSYHDVCYKDTGHIETVKVIYNPQKITYENLAKFFFEIHNPEQQYGQGPDIGYQYISAIFVNNDDETNTIKKLVRELKSRGYFITTKIFPTTTFWEAEEYHQDYYAKNHKSPYCHKYTKRF